MAKPQSTSQRERDITLISDMYLKGMRQVDIAVKTGHSQSTVSRYINRAIERWQKDQVHNIDAQRTVELEKINNIELEAWNAWERSKSDKETKSKKQTSEDRTEVQYRTESLVGDPRFLQQVQWCINKRCELLGLDAPIKTELTGKNGEDLNINIVVK